jgi:hypothetical protein
MQLRPGSNRLTARADQASGLIFTLGSESKPRKLAAGDPGEAELVAALGSVFGREMGEDGA